jgi:hypothetical protein
MPTPFPKNVRDNKHTGSNKGFIFWELVIVLLVIMFTLLYCFSGEFSSNYNAIEYYNSQTTPLMTDKGNKPGAAFVNQSVHDTPISITNNTEPSRQTEPAYAPATIRANFVLLAPAIAQKPEDYPVQDVSSVHPPKPSVQAKFPTKVAVKNVANTTKPVKAIMNTEKPVLESGSYTLLSEEFPDSKETEGISTILSEKEWYSVYEVAKRWNTDKEQIEHYLDTGKLKAAIKLDGVLTRIENYDRMSFEYNWKVEANLCDLVKSGIVLTQAGERVALPKNIVVSDEDILITRQEIERFEMEHSRNPENTDGEGTAQPQEIAPVAEYLDQHKHN